MNNAYKKKLSLSGRLTLIAVSSIIPLTLLIGYLLMVLTNSVKTFDRISNSVNYASRYATEFKERMDYSMYYAIIWDLKLSALREGMYSVGGIELVDPYQYIEELRCACEEMADIATVKSNEVLPGMIENSLNSLEKIVGEIDNNIQEKGHYDENLELLENVRSLTDLIVSNIQEYINVENYNFAEEKEVLMADCRKAVSVCVLAVAIVSLLTVVLSILTLRSVVFPIRKLCEMSRQVAKGNFSARMQGQQEDEIAELTNSFNDMAAEIGYLVDNIRKEQENLRVTESKLLQAQINPHFLYNTLDTIMWLAEAEQKDQVVKMVNYLSEFFRTTLSSGRDYITLQEEEKHVESYLKIQHFRYQDIMEYQIDIDPELGSYLLPKMTLQPLVENALYHGVKNKRGRGIIQICGYRKENSLLLEVKDNGKGMNPERLSNLRKSVSGQGTGSEGFGLTNVNQRLQYYYGKEYGLILESEENKGTCVTVRLPAEKNIQKS